MKINTTYNEFLNEKKNKKNSIKSKVKKIDKKIKKTVGKQEDLVKTAKELADSPEPSDKMKASLAKVQLRQSSARAQELVMRKEAEILKSKIKTAKKKERATNEDMKHVKLFERFITDSDVTRWEREHGKLPIPKEISAMAKDMLKAGFIRKDTTLTQAKLWIALEDVTWIEMEKKFGKLVGKFYGGEFYNEMTDVISIKAAYYAYEVSKSIQDKVANGEDVEPAYYELKTYFNAFGMDYNRSRIFNSAVSLLEEWMKSNKIETL